MKYVIIGMLMALSTACATIDSIDSKTVVMVKLTTESGEIVDISVSSGLTYTGEDGKLYTNNNFVGFYESDKYVYRCEIGLDSYGKIKSQHISIKENCKIEVIK